MATSTDREPVVDADLDLHVSREIAPRDAMFAGNHAHYFGVGRSALRNIRLAMQATGKPAEEVRRILDLPSGHGRVLRNLRAAFPRAVITACDLDRDGVDYCAATFDALPSYGAEALAAQPDAGRFDLIWCGSLLTHLDAPRWRWLLSLFDAWLAPDGLLLFTTHGRLVPRRIQAGWDYGLDVESLRRLIADYQESGFGYVDYPNQSSYGISLARPSWTIALLDRHPRLRPLLYLEHGWDDHQDVVACAKTPLCAPVGPEAERHASIDWGIREED